MGIDRLGEYAAVTRYRPRDQRTAAIPAFAGRGVHPVRAMVAVLDEQLGRRLGRHEQYSTLYYLGLMGSGLV